MAKKSRAVYMKAYRAKRALQTKELTDYGAPAMTGTVPASETFDIAHEIPTGRNYIAGGIADWPDLVYNIGTEAYQLVQTCLPVVETVTKLAARTCKLNWVVMGDSDRAEAIMEIFRQSRNLTDCIEWLTWGKIEGYRVMQIKTAPAREGSMPWVVPNYFMGGRRKEKAGGNVAWDGKRLVQIREASGEENRLAKTLPRWQFIIHRPGAGSNPEGDNQLGVVTYRAARKWEDAMRNIDAYSELYGIPIRVIRAKMDGVTPDTVQAALSERLERLQRLKKGRDIALTDEEIIDLIEPKGQGFKDMIEYTMYLEGLLDQLFLGNTLTSKTNEAGRTGNTETHKDEENDLVFINAIQIAETFNRDLMPWIIKKNPDLPPLKEGEFEPYFWPSPPEEDDEQDIEVEQEETKDGEVDETEPADDTKEVLKDMIAYTDYLENTVEQLQVKATEATNE